MKYLPTYGDHPLTKELENSGYKIRSTVLFLFHPEKVTSNRDVIPTNKKYPLSSLQLPRTSTLFKEINSTKTKRGKHKTIHMLSVGTAPETYSILALLYFYFYLRYQGYLAERRMLNAECRTPDDSEV